MILKNFIYGSSFHMYIYCSYSLLVFRKKRLHEKKRDLDGIPYSSESKFLFLKCITVSCSLQPDRYFQEKGNCIYEICMCGDKYLYI